jgi:hypothetical protein
MLAFGFQFFIPFLFDITDIDWNIGILKSQSGRGGLFGCCFNPICSIVRFANSWHWEMVEDGWNRFGVSIGALFCFGLLLGLILWQDLAMTDPHAHHQADNNSAQHGACLMMGCGFQFSMSVALWRSELATSSAVPFLCSCFVVFAISFFAESLRQQRGKSSKGKRALQHVAQLSLAYLVMLATMSFNVLIFVAAMAGFGVGHFVFDDSTDNNGAACH